jgi:hypothetical protein
MFDCVILDDAVEALQTADLGGTADAALEEDFARLQHSLQALEVERLRRLAELDRRRTFARDGYLSTSAWLAHVFRMSHSSAAGDVRLARALAAMPGTSRAVASGQISSSAARVLVAAHEADSEEYEASESFLVDAAKRLSVRDLQRAVTYWRNVVEARRPDSDSSSDEALIERRRLHVSPTVFGMVRIDGDLDPETGETILTAIRGSLDAAARTRGPDDRRTPAQRRADALGEICRAWLDTPDRPEVAGERPHVTVTVALEALRGSAGQPCELDNVGPISPKVAMQLACDALVSRVVTAGRSEPLDVGRQTPVIPAGIRRGLVVRDRHCRFPGCDRPPAWCDGHHVVHWADGGPTALSNLVLLCRRHHRMAHHGFGIEMTSGGPIFRRPDGSLLEGFGDRDGGRRPRDAAA